MGILLTGVRGIWLIGVSDICLIGVRGIWLIGVARSEGDVVIVERDMADRSAGYMADRSE